MQDDKGGPGLIENSDEIAAAVPELDVAWLDSCLEESIRYVSPAASLQRFLETVPGKSVAKEVMDTGGNLSVYGAGKAAAGFAHAFSEIFHPARSCEMNGPVELNSDHCLVRKGTHPLPDETTVRNSEMLLESALGSDSDSLCFFLLSGGASSMFAIPPDGIEMTEKIGIISKLLESGASISELNCFRRHFSKIKGGRFAASLHPRRIITLAISDVPTGRVEDIGSGPTVADPSSCSDALAVLKRYGLTPMLCQDSMRMLQNGQLESLKPGSDRLRNSMVHVVAGNSDAVKRFAEASRERGVAAITSDATVGSGPAETVKTLIGEGRRRVVGRGVLVAGGESVVRAPEGTRGGRCQHIALVASEFLHENELMVAFGTDGLDGNSSLAGGIGRKSDDDVHDFIDSFESERYLIREGRGIATGATGTNVSDLYIYVRL